MRQTLSALAVAAVLTAGVAAFAQAQYYQPYAGQPGYNTMSPPAYGQTAQAGSMASGTANQTYGAAMQPGAPLSHEYGWGGGFAGYGSTLPSPYNTGSGSQTSPLDRAGPSSGYGGYSR